MCDNFDDVIKWQHCVAVDPCKDIVPSCTVGKQSHQFNVVEEFTVGVKAARVIVSHCLNEFLKVLIVEQ